MSTADVLAYKQYDHQQRRDRHELGPGRPRRPDARRMGCQCYLQSARLVQVLPGYRMPDAYIYVMYPQRHQLSARIRTFVDFLTETFERFD
jgi:DNA-binding transcriptional LysR family regulator